MGFSKNVKLSGTDGALRHNVFINFERNCMRACVCACVCALGLSVARGFAQEQLVTGTNVTVSSTSHHWCQMWTCPHSDSIKNQSLSERTRKTHFLNYGWHLRQNTSRENHKCAGREAVMERMGTTCLAIFQPQCSTPEHGRLRHGDLAWVVCSWLWSFSPIQTQKKYHSGVHLYIIPLLLSWPKAAYLDHTVTLLFLRDA